MSRSTGAAVAIGLMFLLLGPTGSASGATTEAARKATVRIKHYRGKLVATSSGTVVARSGSSVLIATCAHGFHRGNGPFDVEVTFFTDDGPLYRNGTTVAFDHHLDVGLVRVSQAPSTPLIPLARRGSRSSVGEKVVVAGCDGGGTPTAKVTTITAIGRFAGRPNIEVEAVPEDGRSGGALVSENGFLVGVCNGTNPIDDDGLYAGAEALYLLQDPSYRRQNDAAPAVSESVAVDSRSDNYYVRRAVNKPRPRSSEPR